MSDSIWIVEERERVDGEWQPWTTYTCRPEDPIYRDRGEAECEAERENKVNPDFQYRAAEFVRKEKPHD